MMPWRIVELQVKPDWRLDVRFADGLQGTVDLSVFIASDLSRTIFASLRDPAVFAAACLQHGAVTWPGGLDWAPDGMYRGVQDGLGIFVAPPVARAAA